MMIKLIADDDLTLSDIPAADADYGATILVFAQTYDGYAVWGSFAKCAEVAEARRLDTLADLRTCLFFEQRSWRHYGYDPDAKAMLYIRELIEKIRSHVAKRA